MILLVENKICKFILQKFYRLFIEFSVLGLYKMFVEC